MKNYIVNVEFIVQADYLVVQDITNELQQVIQILIQLIPGLLREQEPLVVLL